MTGRLQMTVRSSPIVDELCYRSAMGLLGALLGSIVSFLIALPLLYLEIMSASLARVLLAGVIAGGAVGVITPGALVYVVPTFLYFLGGIFSATLGAIEIAPSASTQRWLLAAFIFGAVYVVVLFLL